MNKPQCLLYSAAMVLDVDVDEITTHIGHDGLEIVDDKLEAPFCYRGVHPQEICDFAWSMLRNFQLIQAMPVLKCQTSETKTEVYPESAGERFFRYVEGKHAIITGINKQGNKHAVAYDGQMILDPNGTTYEIGEFGISEAWVLI